MAPSSTVEPRGRSEGSEQEGTRRDAARQGRRLGPQDCSVIVCSHSIDRFSDLKEAVESIQGQASPPGETLVVIDRDQALHDLASREFEEIKVIFNGLAAGASGARNTGGEVAKGRVLVFFDDDAVAEPDWLERLTEPFDDPDVVGVGGGIRALWLSGRPAWFPKEFSWTVGATEGVLPAQQAEVRNVWTGNMAVRKDAFENVDGFRLGFGKLGTVGAAEDTDFCIRAGKAWPGGKWIFEPSALICHKVSASRASWSYFLDYCHREGRDKAQLAGLVGSTDALASERDHLIIDLPRALLTECGASIRGGGFEPLLRAAAIAAGSFAAVAGYARGMVARTRSRAIPTASKIEGPEASRDGEPVTVASVDLSTPSGLAKDLRAVANGRHAIVLVRLNGIPIGTAHVDPMESQNGDGESQIWQQLGTSINAELERLGLASVADLPGLATSVAAHRKANRAEREALLAAGGLISIVVCTRERSEQLKACLKSLLELDYPNFEIIVVDNAPETSETKELVCGMADHAAGSMHGELSRSVRYVAEPRPGLSRARNRGIAAATGSIVAFTDDDAIADPGWAIGLSRGFASSANVGCVTGATMPAELDTKAQQWFEQFGGHGRPNSSVREIVPAGGADDHHPLYPFPPFGAGVNMAFCASALSEIGGFDSALGAGSATMGGEDTAAFAQVVMSGRKLVYEPSAFVSHHHRRDYESLHRLLHGYGIALTAYFTWCVHRHLAELPRLTKMLPSALRYLLGRDTAHKASLQSDFPPTLIRAQRRGMLIGPFAYMQSLRARRRADSEAQVGQ